MFPGILIFLLTTFFEGTSIYSLESLWVVVVVFFFADI